ncbi:hypothetical protein SPRG_13290 [Saprolegnia parasitica CBS 223.65]|uniref:Secreted protein n=1 Tax=Saprolegnia parasitica (strain CBS 223.65) TaxID=695850 RepID=A0A067C4Y3_SAPPC|nr:hypothetical protein SPRG_13290 [Saprolegnia parasitica CBS 223.65]KDO21606.1 hypothetical protein SPRG_13290 [Saprolegnia parasitica CBS 223.65]|eukprot:XP_012207692.1 hypothetical protein SPRG_13290 [Saprolegnia parasitica CBS 223.65]
MHHLLALTWMLLTTTRHGAAAPCSMAQNTSHAQAIAANISTSCAAALHMPPDSATFYSVASEEGSYTTLCQPACSDDLANYTSRVPSCDEANTTSHALTLLQSYCYNLTHPTMDGGACTGADAALFIALASEPLWSNCSSNASSNVIELSLDTTVFPAYCGSPNCVANIAAVHNKVPNCNIDRSDPGANFRVAMQRTFNCTPGDAGGTCTAGDLQTLTNLATLPVWANCSQALNLPPSTNFTTFLTTETPPQWCATTCPAYVAVAFTTHVLACDLTTIPTNLQGPLGPIFSVLAAAHVAVASMGVAAAQAAALAKECPVTSVPTTPKPVPKPAPTPTPTPRPTPTPTPTRSIAAPVTMSLLGACGVVLAMLL